MLSLEEVLDDPQVRHNEVARSSASTRRRRASASRVRPRASTARPRRPRRLAPLLGEHTDEVLAELGLSADERRQLREAGVVA